MSVPVNLKFSLLLLIGFLQEMALNNLEILIQNTLGYLLFGTIILNTVNIYFKISIT